MMTYVQLMRLKHWVKNILLFFPSIFSGKLLDKRIFGDVVAGFFVFSITSSVVYVFNDLRDVKKDQKNPKKKSRPIASGAITERKAVIIIAALAAAIGGIATFSHLNRSFWEYLACYVFINVCYSL